MKYNFTIKKKAFRMNRARISFIQLNMKKSFAAAVELNNLVKESSNYICLLSEPYAYKEKLSSLPPNSNKFCNQGAVSYTHLTLPTTPYV